MKAHHLISALAFTLVAAAGAASAQTSGSVTVTTSTASTTPAAGASGAGLGSVTLQATQSGDAGNISIASLPLTLTAGSGASVGNLTGCQLFNPNGQALNTGSNAGGTAAASNTFTFDMPLQISGGQSVTLDIRCNVASGTVSGGTFQFAAGMPTFSPSLAINLNVSPNVRPAAQDTLMALFTLSGSRSGSATQISSVPLNVSFANGAAASHLSDCRVRNLSNLAAPLNNGGNAVGIVQGSNMISLDVPLQVSANSSATLALTCDVSSLAPLGGTITLRITPSDFKPTVVGTGTSVTPTTGFTSTGEIGSTTGIATISNAAGAPIPTVPGVPNTGGEGMALMLVLSGIAALFGLFMARKTIAMR